VKYSISKQTPEINKDVVTKKASLSVSRSEMWLPVKSTPQWTTPDDNEVDLFCKAEELLLTPNSRYTAFKAC